MPFDRPAPHHPARRSVGVAIAAAAAMLLAACGAGPDILSPGERAGAAAEQVQDGPGGDIATEAPAPTTGPTPPPLVVDVDDVTATVGERAAIVIEASDADGAVAVVATELVGQPPGVGDDGTWIPETAGTWDATIRVTDDLGRIGEHPIRFRSRYPASPDTLVAIGDSVASGHGLQARDYFGGDPCFRSDDGYPGLVAAELIERGVFGETGAAFVVACSGAGVADLTTVPVTGGSPDWAPPGADALTQIEWAVRANPAVVTVTVGINDIGFVEPAGLIVGGRLDEAAFDARVASMANALGALVARLVAETDADVVVTGYYNPAAARPQGIEGCELDCFRTIAARAVERVDTAMVSALPADPRVRFVTLFERFADHGAPNGLGLDSARAGEGVLGEVFGGPFVGTQAYCARGDTVGESWINALDCVHPDDEGHRQIAAAVLDAL